MRYPARAALTLIALAVAACSASERNDLSPTGVVRFQMNDPSRVDTVGTADLVVDYGSTARNWVVRDENIGANFCSAIEGGVEPGLRRLLRFTVTTPNVGNADVFVGDPKAHMDPNGDGSTAEAARRSAPCTTTRRRSTRAADDCPTSRWTRARRRTRGA